ncbi:GNAT family N-acetyltransferase [Pseudarthrobacter sp. So.54]
MNLGCSGLRGYELERNRPLHARTVQDQPQSVALPCGWPQVGDFGVVAETDDGTPIGGAWCRNFTPDNAGYGFVAEDIPELTIGVLPDYRGNGAGTALMASLIEVGRSHGVPAISLSVEDGNRARLLYERMGFSKVGRNGGSDTLLHKLGNLS